MLCFACRRGHAWLAGHVAQARGWGSLSHSVHGSGSTPRFLPRSMLPALRIPNPQSPIPRAGNAAALHEEWGNILAGMEMAYAHKQWHLVLSYAQGLDEIWLNEGRYPEAQVGYQQASEAAEQLGDVAALAHFLCKQAVASLEQADDEVAAALLERSLTLCQEVGNQVEEAEVLFCLGRLAIEQKRFDQGQGWLERCRQIRTTLGDQAGIARTLYLEADIPYYQEAYEEAKRLGEQALTIQLDVQDQLGAIQSLGLLADCAIKQSAYAVAERHCQDALTFCDAIGDQIERSVILYIYGEVKRLVGAFEEAELYLKESLALFSFMRDRRMEARTLLRLRNVYINNNET